VVPERNYLEILNRLVETAVYGNRVLTDTVAQCILEEVELGFVQKSITEHFCSKNLPHNMPERYHKSGF
jgi:hypothetical protein